MIAIDLFAGAGGAALGLSMAGFQHVACIEGDRDACATLSAAGFPAVWAWVGGHGPDGQPAYQWPDDHVDLLWASPPCQPYSTAGDRRGSADPRDGWQGTLTGIKATRPTWIIVENVPGCPVDAWSTDLSALGYTVSTATLDAADWGLPSHRKRVFIVGGPTGYQWPTPTHYGPDTPYFLREGRVPWVGFSEAIGVIGALVPGNGGNLPKPRTDGPAHTVTACCGLYLSPAPTVCTTNGVGLGSKASRDLWQRQSGRRKLTWQECAALVGFPADYPFQGTSSAKYRQIGNAVAPIMARVLAACLPCQ